MVGIKGVGMTALAQILKSQGKIVSGSDTTEKFFTDGVLKKLKIPFKEGFKASNLPKADLVIYSTAFNPKIHPELLAAKNKKLATVTYPQAVSQLFNSSMGIAVSGTHGKTTTSALIAESLKLLGLDPTALIGSRVTNWKTNALAGKSPFFVIEADEHQNKLRFYNPWSLVLTNVDYDHPDYYPKESDYYQAFKIWVGKWAKKKFPLPKIGVLNGDDPKIQKIIQELKLKDQEGINLVTFGQKKSNHVRILELVKGKLSLEINYPKLYSKKIIVNTGLIGKHNAYNLAAAFGFASSFLLLIREVSQDLAIQPAKIDKLINFTAKSLEKFQGTERRMQLKGIKGKVEVYDDYGHHPEEVQAALSAIKEAYPKKELFVIFQPHTYTRTKEFLKEFASVLKTADKIGLLEIYGSARENNGKISSQDIQKLIKSKSCWYFPTHQDCLEFLNKQKFAKPTILVTMGAGDGWQIGEKFLKK